MSGMATVYASMKPFDFAQDKHASTKRCIEPVEMKRKHAAKKRALRANKCCIEPIAAKNHQ